MNVFVPIFSKTKMVSGPALKAVSGMFTHDLLTQQIVCASSHSGISRFL